MLKKKKKLLKKKSKLLAFSPAWALAFSCQFSPDRERLEFLRKVKLYKGDRVKAALEMKGL